jgi:hypothetical protein
LRLRPMTWFVSFHCEKDRVIFLHFGGVFCDSQDFI